MEQRRSRENDSCGLWKVEHGHADSRLLIVGISALHVHSWNLIAPHNEQGPFVRWFINPLIHYKDVIGCYRYHKPEWNWSYLHQLCESMATGAPCCMSICTFRLWMSYFPSKLMPGMSECLLGLFQGVIRGFLNRCQRHSVWWTVLYKVDMLCAYQVELVPLYKETMGA